MTEAIFVTRRPPNLSERRGDALVRSEIDLEGLHAFGRLFRFLHVEADHAVASDETLRDRLAEEAA
jgi:hypothetical protein